MASFDPRSFSFSLIFFAASLVSGASSLLVVWKWRSTLRRMNLRILELEKSLEASVEHRAAERKGRIRAQQALRETLVEKKTLDGVNSSYPMVPIGFIESCFSTRNGTPRQPLLVPLARACLILSPNGVPATAFDGLNEYSHCWLLYIFHANTDLPHIWKHPNHKDFKAKVRVPRLDGGKMGVYATRTPHRPCPIGLTVAKVEGVQGRMLLISGADLVDGTPVLDVKPYLPYCDSVPNAVAPSWVNAGGDGDPIALISVQFSSKFWDSLLKSWEVLGKNSMYSSPQEFQKLVEQVLSRDIRSVRQRTNPKSSLVLADEEETMPGNDANLKSATQENGSLTQNSSSKEAIDFKTQFDSRGNEDEQFSNTNLVLYRLVLEGFIITYTVYDGHVIVHGTEISEPHSGIVRDCNQMTWAKVSKSNRVLYNIDRF